MITNFNKWGQQFRAKYFTPVFSLLTKLKITPNHITFFRSLGGPVFVILFPYYPRLAAVIIVMATLLDWFDGGLARYQNNGSDRGKFWDVLVDHTNYVFAIFAIFFLQIYSSVQIGYHLLIVPVLYLLATIKESEYSKTDWIIHPYYTIVYFKIFAILAMFLLVFFQIDIVNATLFCLNMAMTLWSIHYIIVLNKRWKHKHKP